MIDEKISAQEHEWEALSDFEFMQIYRKRLRICDEKRALLRLQAERDFRASGANATQCFSRETFRLKRDFEAYISEFIEPIEAYFQERGRKRNIEWERSMAKREHCLNKGIRYIQRAMIRSRIQCKMPDNLTFILMPAVLH